MNVCVWVKGVEKENIVKYIFFWRFFFSTPGEWQISLFDNMLYMYIMISVNAVSWCPAILACCLSHPHAVARGAHRLCYSLLINICFVHLCLVTSTLSVTQLRDASVTMATSEVTVKCAVISYLHSVSNKVSEARCRQPLLQ